MMKNNQSTRQATATQLFKGYVTEVNPTTATARIRVDDHDGMISWWLQILQTRVKNDKSLYLVDVGDLVVAIADERLESGYILGAFYTEQNPPPRTTIDSFYHEFSDGSTFEFTRSNGVLTINVTDQIVINAPNGIQITNGSSESAINGKAIAVIGAMDNDDESSGPDAIVSSGQL